MSITTQSVINLIIMTSFIETNEQVVDFNTINAKLRQPSKHFAFFVYHTAPRSQPQLTHLQKLAFTIKEDKGWGSEKTDHGKLIHMHFVDLENQADVEQSLAELKIAMLQNPKTKLIFYSPEEHYTRTIAKAKTVNIDLTGLPAAIYSPDLHEDLTQHLGWRSALLGNLAEKSSAEFQQNVKTWISSPGQRVDMWKAMVSVDDETGSIHRLDPATGAFSPILKKQIDEHFISHLCLGHHAQLAANYQTNRKQHNHSFLNSIIFKIESMKKFCCLGSPSLQASTGIVSIFFQDNKGCQHEITKELVKEGSKKGIMSLLLSNIDKFMGIKLNGGRLNDGKLELGVCESSDKFRLIDTSGGEIVVRMNAEQVFMSVGSACLRLVHPKQLRVKLWGKVKLLISKDTLEC